MSRRSHIWKFDPHPLVANSHLQTVLGVRWPRRNAPYRATVHYLQLEDGDQLALHEDQPAKATDDTPSILLVHGLAGCFESTYMCRMAEKLVARGYRAFRLDMRGCGAGEYLARLPTHCGRSTDVASALNTIAELHCGSATILVAFSMGGTQSLNMLAEAGEMRVGNLERTLVVCPPIDMAAAERHFRTSFGRIYDKFFVNLLWQQTQRRWHKFPETAPKQIPRSLTRIRDLDELVTAPSSGFASAEDYYRQASPGPKLTSIRQPVTVVFSQDDPVVPCEHLLGFPLSASVEIALTRHGGHLGYLGRPGADPDFRWLDWRILDWIEECMPLTSPTDVRERVRTA